MRLIIFTVLGLVAPNFVWGDTLILLDDSTVNGRVTSDGAVFTIAVENNKTRAYAAAKVKQVTMNAVRKNQKAPPLTPTPRDLEKSPKCQIRLKSGVIKAGKLDRIDNDFVTVDGGKIQRSEVSVILVLQE